MGKIGEIFRSEFMYDLTTKIMKIIQTNGFEKE
jgi:hypothetical protein